jgi:hypothetical protein
MSLDTASAVSEIMLTADSSITLLVHTELSN